MQLLFQLLWLIPSICAALSAEMSNDPKTLSVVLKMVEDLKAQVKVLQTRLDHSQANISLLQFRFNETSAQAENCMSWIHSHKVILDQNDARIAVLEGIVSSREDYTKQIENGETLESLRRQSISQRDIILDKQRQRIEDLERKWHSKEITISHSATQIADLGKRMGRAEQSIQAIFSIQRLINDQNNAKFSQLKNYLQNQTHFIALSQEKFNILESMQNTSIGELKQTQSKMQVTMDDALQQIKIDHQKKIEEGNEKLQASQLMLVNQQSSIEHFNSEFAQLSNKIKSQQVLIYRSVKRVVALEAVLKDSHTKISAMETSLEKLLPPPFQLPHTAKMNQTLKSYRSTDGLRPIVSNTSGEYNVIDWKTLGGEYSWKDHWNRMKVYKGGWWLGIPPLLLPTEYGGWLISLFIEWSSDRKQLEIRGFIPAVAHNADCPYEIMVNMEISLSSDQYIILHTRSEYPITKGFSVLVVITNKIESHWEIPKAQIRVLPLKT